jgi:hypothetical protein
MTAFAEGDLGPVSARVAALAKALPDDSFLIGMVQAAVARGEVAASWQATGADVVVAATGQRSIDGTAQRAITTVPGVRHAAAALVLPVYLPGGQVMTAIAVDPASYAAVVASAPGFPAVRPALLARPRGGAAPVLASPQAAAALRQAGNGTIGAPQYGIAGLPVRVAGVLASTPALPAGGSFIVIPSPALRGPGVPQANLLLLNGPSIDMAKLNAAVGATIQGAGTAFVSTRAQALQDLAQAPAQHGTFLFFTLALAYAAVLAVAVILLELASGAAEREVTLARLATMGLPEGQRVRLVAIELLPAIAAAAAAAAACAVILPGLVSQQINLSVFTRSPVPPTLRADPASVLVPLAGLLAVTVIALAHEVRSGRGRGVAVTMRT